MKNNIIKGPIVIGGVGGSGTRIVAELIKEIGFYLGCDLNHANDNLLFTFLFKRPRWYLSNCNNWGEIKKGLTVFEGIMTTRFDSSIKDMDFINRIMIKDFYSDNKNKAWVDKRLSNIPKYKEIDLNQYLGWGFKEPNSHIYLENLSKYFKEMKYIHVIRHGLDMAFSENQYQLHNWGSLFGINIPNDGARLPKASLNYWIKSNKEAIRKGRELLGNNFILLKFDELYLEPKKQIDRMIDFLEVKKPIVRKKFLYTLPQKPRTSGRYRKNDLSIFTENQINEVINLGFTVEGLNR
ncbi:MAG: sulfotransferase [Maledivibacter sp.]|jgi:hypothetical protein|nr:sulfotransferase [Maledivibacter sp.]